MFGINPIRALGEIGVRAWPERNGVSSNDVKFTVVPYSAMDTALASGRIDAARAEDYWSTRDAVRAGRSTQGTPKRRIKATIAQKSAGYSRFPQSC